MELGDKVQLKEYPEFYGEVVEVLDTTVIVLLEGPESSEGYQTIWGIGEIEPHVD